MKTRTLLMLVFGLSFAIVVGRGFWWHAALRGMLTENATLVERHERLDSALQRVAAIAIDLETGVRGWLATGDRQFLEPYERAASERGRALEDLATLEQSGGTAGEAPLVGRLRSELAAWETETARPLLAPDIASHTASERLALNRLGKERMDAIRVTLAELRAALAARRAGTAASFDRYRQQILTQTWTTSVALGLFFLLSGWTMRRWIERPLSVLAEHAERTAHGDFAPVNVTGVLEVRSLGDAMTYMSARLAEDRDRERRFTELVTALSEGGDVSTIASVALRALATEQAAIGGALWIAPDKHAPLRLGASFALDAAALDPAGDPMAREVRASQELIHLTDLEGAAHVLRNAILDAVPRSLLVAPVRAGGTVVGVVELAGNVRGTLSGDFERSLARVGLALQNALGGERLSTLRDELASVNEELQAQNEELRTQEEELRAQSGELATKQSELAHRNEELIRASQLKSDFLSNMSHELRTPLNAVIGFADVLLGGAQGELSLAQRESLTDILGAGKQLLSLVNDILNLSKIESGRVELVMADFDLADPALDALSLLETLAARKNLRLDNQVARGSVLAAGDRGRVRQVLVNLISNAIKFTPDGGTITITSHVERGHHCVRVADTGIGIAAKDLARLFHPFSQLEAAPAGGTGLGLSICKRLVEAMHGEIGFTSEPGRGSVFFFTLPLAEVRAAGAARSLRSTPTATRWGKRTVLLVEDARSDALVTEGVLTRGGYPVHTVRTAEGALVALESHQPGLLIVDLGLPGMSGFDLIDRVRATKAGAELPIVVLTGRDLSEAERARLERSVQLVAQKGLMTGAGFLDSVASLQNPAPGPRPPSPRSALVIDDSEVNRRVVAAMLGPAGYHVLEAPDASSGIALARERSPSVVLMDIRMPGMDGLEATRALGADPLTSQIPVIALSAQAMLGDRERALTSGCFAYLSKPVGRRELVDAVERALAARVTKAEPGDQP